MSMFRGINAVNLDAKWRMGVPVRYRDDLQSRAQGKLILTIDTEAPCLLLYPLPEWEIIEAKLEALPSFNPAARRIQRLLIGHATEVELDASGRILLPPVLREYGALDKKAVFIGQGKKFEIWSEQNWQQHRDTWLADVGSVEGLPDALKGISL